MNRTPSFSIIIPVLNEAENINGVIAHLHAVEPDEHPEIIVVDGDQEGGTIRAITAAGVRAVISKKGRACQMNHGASLASGDILLFLHADTLLPRMAFSLIRSSLRDDRIVAGAFDLGIDSDRRIFRVTENYVALRTLLTRVPFGDQAIFIRREYFTTIGGFHDIPIMEDVDLMKRIRRQGGRICIIPEKVLTSPRRYEQEGIVSCTLRNWLLQIFFAFGVQPERLARWYRSS
jgi:rSAM/selenodomain-associated transferase 2